MTRGVPPGITSKRDTIRAWIDQQGWEPITIDAVKARYDAIDGVPHKWSVYEAKRVVAETHYLTDDDVWVRRKNSRNRRRNVILAPIETEAKEASVLAPIPESSPIKDFSSWDHPLLATAISTWNTVKSTPEGHPNHLTVDFRNREWMHIYTQATLSAGKSPGPIDCAVFIATSISNSISEKTQARG